MKKFLLSLMIMFATAVCLVGCGDKTITVKYETNGGAPIADATAEEGQSFTAATPEHRDGYDFDGWYTDDKFTTAYSDSVLQAAYERGDETLTLYAKWVGNYNMYYHTYQSDDPGTVNYWDSKESTVADLADLVFGGYWGTKMNEEKDGYEWYSMLAKEKPVAVNPDPVTSLATKYKFEVRVGEELVYSTLSQVAASAAYNGREVKLEDYLTPWKELYNQSNGLERGAENLTGAQSIKGINDYYKATATGYNEAAWNNVGIRTYEEDGKSYLEFEFNVPQNTFYAMYYLASGLYTPIPAEFITYVGGMKNYGTYNEKASLTPVDTCLSTSYFVLEAWETQKEIVFKKNELIEDEGRYQIAGIHYQVLAAVKTDPEAALKEFLINNLDAVGIPSTQLEQYKNDPRATTTLDSSTFKLNLNTCTQEEWEALFGENGTITQTPANEYWDVKPIMSNANFLRGLSYSINRKNFAEIHGRSATGNYFGSAYLSDPENGVSYNSTQAHLDATKQALEGTDGTGYSLALAQEYFKKACDELIADGTYKQGDEIVLEIAWMEASQEETDHNPVKKYIEDAFNGCGGGLTVRVDFWAGPIWSDVYYAKMMVGQFDIGFGSISGNALNPINFLEVLRSDNTSGFTLNWGVDTSEVSEELVYDGKTWSFNALWQAADQGALVADGVLVDAYDVKLISSAQNADKSRTVKFSIATVATEGVDIEVADVVLCNYQRYYFGDEEYEEKSIDFTVENGIITATIDAATEEAWKGYIGFDVYLNQELNGVASQVYTSFYSFNYELDEENNVTDTVYTLEDDGERASVAEGGEVISYVALNYEERTKILGALEKYAVENFLTGLTLYGDGGYVMYQDRLVPGSGSWENYIPGYGFGTTAEGSITKELGK